MAAPLGAHLVRIATGTHRKVLVMDGRVAVVGSWNWLSNGEERARRELSVIVRDEGALIIAEQYRAMQEAANGRDS